MDPAGFTQLVRDLVEAMGQRLEAARPIPQGLALRTSDDYLYVFVEDVERGSPEAVRAWCEEGDVPAERLVVFALAPLPPSWGPEVQRGGGTVVAGRDFQRLVDELGIDSPLVERDPSIHRPLGSALPSARELDADMLRARTWESAGVLPLAARFYGHAVALKPEFLAGWVGLGWAKTGMGAWDEAEAAWNRVLALDPGSVEGRMGLAAVAGGRGNVDHEMAIYRTILADHPRLTAPRAALVAALVDRGLWADACREVESLLALNPSEPRLRFLHAVFLERSGGDASVVASERAEARRGGLTEGEGEELMRSFGTPARVTLSGT